VPPPGLTCIPASEARRLLAGWGPAPAIESVSLAEAPGRVLAGEVRAGAPVPEFPRAAMDGFAVRATDVAGAEPGAPVVLRLAGRVAMGEPSAARVGPGEAVAVSTGAQLPPGADAVVKLEETVAEPAGAVQVLRPVEVGRHVVAAGEEFEADSVVLPRGRPIAGPDVAALAAFGVRRVAVFRRARVAILSTGSELCPADEDPGPARVRDINQPALAAAVQAAGARATRAGIVPEDPEALVQVLNRLTPSHDLVVVSGGTSVGARDFTAEAIRRLGAELLFHGLEVRPGRPPLAARLGDHLVFGLPGVPAAALTIFQMFVEPVLRARQGEAPTSRPAARVAARLETAYASRRGREDYLRVRLTARDGETWASPLPGPTSLSALVRSDGLVVVPEEVEALGCGSTVDVRLP
jgi:molybdopterin molybdotransferase